MLRIKQLLLILALSACPMLTSAQVVIINQKVSVEKLPSSVVRSIFLMRLKEWNDGRPITVFVLNKNNSAHLTFCREILGLFPYQLEQAWDRQIFAGIGQAPIFVKSSAELKNRVSTTPGSIGYANEKDIDDTVKMIEVLHASH